ncbi:MAG: alpha/beta fold hydrolase [Acidimicrobiia bacterium]|nr:alpha/beta fold hydrolase [Acidimicrobiia bacterium]
MPTADANGITLCYDTFGDPAAPALLLVMGFTAQMTAWDERFCRLLAERGLHVVRFDNRDCGLSTHLDGQEVDLMALYAAHEGGGDYPPVPYGLSAFADDAFALLDQLGVAAAHVLGASMGGMIVQAMAIARPERVLSMTSVMSTTGEEEFGQAKPEVMAALLAPPPTERDAFVQHTVSRAKLFCGPRYFDDDATAERAAAAYDRAFYPEGATRQLAAIWSSGERAEALRSLAVPTLVIHGRADTLIDKSGGERTAELVPGANLLLLHDMGHDLPEPLWPLVVDAVASHTTHRIG